MQPSYLPYELKIYQAIDPTQGKEEFSNRQKTLRELTGQLRPHEHHQPDELTFRPTLLD